jgi:hypothetical protein
MGMGVLAIRRFKSRKGSLPFYLKVLAKIPAFFLISGK